MITIYTVAYNEQVMLPYFVAHYSQRFPDCRIIVYNNMSDDNTKKIALDLGCEVVDYDTGDKLSDSKYLDIKNNVWKHAETDWVLIVDMDEHCIISKSDLLEEAAAGTNILRFEGWNMVNMRNNLAVETIEYGVRAPSYDKSYCFNRIEISEIMYNPGCHKANPVTVMGAYPIKYSENAYKCLHYKYLNVEYMVKRHALFASRLSEDNRKKGYGGHYLYPASKIKREFQEAQRNAIKVI